MSAIRLNKITSSISDVNSLQANVEDALSRIDSPLLSGRVLEGISLTTTATKVPHGLGKPWTGYVIVRNPDSIAVTETIGSLDHSFITLTASADGTVNILVF